MAIAPFWFLTEHPWRMFMPFWLSADDTFTLIWELFMPSEIQGVFCKLTVRAPVFNRYQFFGTSEHYGKTHGSLLSGWMNYNYTACCWFPTSSNILTLLSQFWQIRFWKLLIALFKSAEYWCFYGTMKIQAKTRFWYLKDIFLPPRDLEDLRKPHRNPLKFIVIYIDFNLALVSIP